MFFSWCFFCHLSFLDFFATFLGRKVAPKNFNEEVLLERIKVGLCRLNLITSNFSKEAFSDASSAPRKLLFYYKVSTAYIS